MFHVIIVKIGGKKMLAQQIIQILSVFLIVGVICGAFAAPHLIHESRQRLQARKQKMMAAQI